MPCHLTDRIEWHVDLSRTRKLVFENLFWSCEKQLIILTATQGEIDGPQVVEGCPFLKGLRVGDLIQPEIRPYLALFHEMTQIG